MPEVILPGTYISVRDEGLMSAGRIATGYIGVVGTAEKGPYNRPVIVGSLSEAREIFGLPGTWRGGHQNELTLMRTLELIFNNGGSTVYAVRAAPKGAAHASKPVKKGSTAVMTLRSRDLGSPGNSIRIRISDVTGAPSGTAKQLQLARVVERYSGKTAKELAEAVNTGSSLVEAVLADAGSDKAPDDLDAAIAGGPTATLLEVKSKTAPVMTLKPKAPTGDGRGIQVRIVSDKAGAKTLELGPLEIYTGATSAALAAEVNTSSSFALAEVAAADQLPEDVEGSLEGGTDGEAAGDYALGLEALENEIVNIVVLAGQDAKQAALLQAHLNRTAQIQRERIGVIGSDGFDDLDAIADHTLASDRLIYVAPGIRTRISDPVTGEEREVNLPGAYTAAAVAGLISSLPVHVSPTNKTLAIGGVSTAFNSSRLEKLVQKRVLAVEKREGFRVVKGITTSTNPAWHQITTRRIVDYAVYGVRSACNPYVGKLNNDRVRSAMKATLDGFLTRMVDDEALVGYSLEVSATRAQEIAGECQVVMTIQPTFSIDFIKVTMYLS